MLIKYIFDVEFCLKQFRCRILVENRLNVEFSSKIVSMLKVDQNYF